MAKLSTGTTISSSLEVFQGVSDAISAIQANEVNQEIMKGKMALNKLHIQDIKRTAGRKTQGIRRKAAQVTAEQQLATASQDLEITSGNAADLQAETQFRAQEDVNELLAQGSAQAMGVEIENLGLRTQMKIDDRATRTQAYKSISSAGLKVTDNLAQAGAFDKDPGTGKAGTGDSKSVKVPAAQKKESDEYTLEDYSGDDFKGKVGPSLSSDSLEVKRRRDSFESILMNARKTGNMKVYRQQLKKYKKWRKTVSSSEAFSKLVERDKFLRDYRGK